MVCSAPRPGKSSAFFQTDSCPHPFPQSYADPAKVVKSQNQNRLLTVRASTVARWWFMQRKEKAASHITLRKGEGGSDSASYEVTHVPKNPPRYLTLITFQRLGPSLCLGRVFQRWFWNQTPGGPNERCRVGLLLRSCNRIRKWTLLKIGRQNWLLMTAGLSSCRVVMPFSFSLLWWIWTHSCISSAHWRNAIIGDTSGHSGGYHTLGSYKAHIGGTDVSSHPLIVSHVWDLSFQRDGSITGTWCNSHPTVSLYPHHQTQSSAKRLMPVVQHSTSEKAMLILLECWHVSIVPYSPFLNGFI